MKAVRTGVCGAGDCVGGRLSLEQIRSRHNAGYEMVSRGELDSEVAFLLREIDRLTEVLGAKEVASERQQHHQ